MINGRDRVMINGKVRAMLIETEADYHEAINRFNKLFDADLNHDEAVEFNELLEAIMAYEDEHFPIDASAVDSVSEEQEWHDFDPDC